MKKYLRPAIIACYSATELKDMILAGACSVYSVDCGCYGGPQKKRR